MRVLTIITALAFFMLSSVTVITADDTMMGAKGNSVYPLSSKNIRLDSEEVNIKIIPADKSGQCFIAKVVCSFNLVKEDNGDTENEVLIGFPASYPAGPAYDHQNSIRVRNFSATVDGKSLQVEKKRNLALTSLYKDWYVLKVDFANRDKMTLISSYDCFLTCDSNAPSGYLSYMLTTGAYWKGNIKKAKIVIDAGPWEKKFVSVRPAGWKMDGDKIVWEFSDFEPKEDIEISYHSPGRAVTFVEPSLTLELCEKGETELKKVAKEKASAFKNEYPYSFGFDKDSLFVDVKERCEKIERWTKEGKEHFGF